MSNERALMIIEAMQLPQVVASSVSADEIEYQRLERRKAMIYKELATVAKSVNDMKVRLIDAWFAEHYPGLPYKITTTEINNGIRLEYTLDVSLTSLSVTRYEAEMLYREIGVYLRQITT